MYRFVSFAKHQSSMKFPLAILQIIFILLLSHVDTKGITFNLQERKWLILAHIRIQNNLDKRFCGY
jgi:hypothetical protein